MRKNHVNIYFYYVVILIWWCRIEIYGFNDGKDGGNNDSGNDVDDVL